MEKKLPPPPPPPSLDAKRSIPRMPPPPPPNRRRLSAAPGPIPAGIPPEALDSDLPPPPSNSAKTTNTQQLILAASSALRLRDEQLRARVQYFNAELETNAELDAITAQVVAELKAMTQGQMGSGRSTQEVEIELIHALRGLLEKLLSPKRSAFLHRKLEEVQRRISQLFFNSELYARLQQTSSELPLATWPEQALYFSLKRYEDFIEGELDATPATQEVRERAKERLQTFMRSLCNEFLARTTPELERLLAIYKAVLLHFFQEIFPHELGDFAWEVIRESRVAVGHDLGYKLTVDKFDAFREVFDRKFLERLLLSVQERIVQKATESSGFFREATLRFVADPQIHAEICSVINDAFYDYLHEEGFLDLPPDWRSLEE